MPKKRASKRSKKNQPLQDDSGWSEIFYSDIDALRTRGKPNKGKRSRSRK